MTGLKFLMDDFGNFMYPLFTAIGAISVILQKFNGSYIGYKCLLYQS